MHLSFIQNYLYLFFFFLKNYREKAKKKPKYIFTDNYCRHAEILAKKHNIPLIVGFGTFWIYDYPYDLRDDIIEKLFIGG